MLDRERPDFVDIATRPESHLELTRLRRSAAFTSSARSRWLQAWEDCLAMVEACEAAGVRLLIHENWRWQPWYREARRLLDAGVLGQPFHLGLPAGAPATAAATEPYSVQPYFREMPRLLVYETLVHFLDTFRFLGGEIASVYCQNGRINPRDPSAKISRAGAVAFVSGRTRPDRRQPHQRARATGQSRWTHLTIEGDRRHAAADRRRPPVATEHGAAEREHDVPDEQPGLQGRQRRATQDHLIECLRSGQRSESEGRDYLATVQSVEACYRSAETGSLSTL